VTDRASTIGFSAVDYAGFLQGSAAEQASDPLELPPDTTHDKNFLGTFTLASASDSHAMAEHLTPFVRLNELLVAHDQHYGYRVLNDVAAYVRAVNELIGQDESVLHAAVDSCVLQKVLPKFFSWKADRGGLLATLLAFALHGEVEHGGRGLDAEALLDSVDVDPTDRVRLRDGGTAYLPRSAGRLVRMLHAMG
jgi:hypothetical protein